MVDPPSAMIENGDEISIDAENCEMTLHISDDEMQKRRDAWVQPEPRYKRGVLAKYAAQVISAAEGALTDTNLS